MSDELNDDKVNYGLVRIKRTWVPECVFSMFAYPVDLMRHKWLPFRYILTKECSRRMMIKVHCESINLGEKPLVEEISIPIKTCKYTGEELLTEEAIELIDKKKVAMMLNQLKEAVREINKGITHGK